MKFLETIDDTATLSLDFFSLKLEYSFAENFRQPSRVGEGAPSTVESFDHFVAVLKGQQPTLAFISPYSHSCHGIISLPSVTEVVIEDETWRKLDVNDFLSSGEVQRISGRSFVEELKKNKSLNRASLSTVLKGQNFQSPYLHGPAVTFAR